MNNPRLSKRYAKSLVDLSVELNKLEEAHTDVLLLQNIIGVSRDFKSMLTSPVINADKKFSIINAVTQDKLSALTSGFIKLLCKKNREGFLPGIVNAFITQYNQLKGLHSATLTTAVPVSDAIREDFITKLKRATAFDHIELKTEIDDTLIGGFVLEIEGKLLDGSILRDLKDVKKQFDNNDYLHKLR